MMIRDLRVSPQGSSKKGSSSRSDPAPRPIKKKKDLIERLMEKGLIPLAALDIIRGWMVLEMASSSDMDKALVKASTQNKLGYDSIRQALLAMHEDRDRQSGVGHKGKGKGYYAHWLNDDWSSTYFPNDYDNEYDTYQTEARDYDSSWEDSYYGQEQEWQEETEQAEEVEDETHDHDTEKMAMLTQLQEEEQKLQVMMADTQRNLQQARQAVAQARRDRGWHSGGKPSSRPTSTFMKGQGMNKGKSKLTGKGTSPSSPVMWATKGSSKGKSKFSPKGYSGKNSYYQDYYESGMLALETVDEDFQLYANEMHAPGSQSSGASSVEAGGTKGVVDTGATVTAGGKQAVEDLLKGLAQARPDLQVTVVQADRPYFRYGSGRWGQALYRVQLSFGSYTFNVYALPSKNVPVLVGMRELKQMGMILNTGNCHALIGGHPRILSKTSKGHALLDFATDIPYTPQPSRSHHKQVHFSESTQQSFMVEFDFSSYECHAQHASDDDQVSTDEPVFPLFAVQQEQSHDSTRFIHDFLGVDASAWSFLIGPQSSVFSGSDRSFPRFQPQPNSASADHVGDLQPRHQSSGQRCSQGSHGRENEGERPEPGISNTKIESQGEVINAKGQVRRVQEDDSHVQLRSQNEPGSMAMHGDSHRSRQQQSLGKVARVRDMRSSLELHSSRGCPSEFMQDRPWPKCDRGSGEIEEHGVDKGRACPQHSQEHGEAGCGRESDHQAKGVSNHQGQEPKEGETHRGGRSAFGRFLRGSRPKDFEANEGSKSLDMIPPEEDLWLDQGERQLSQAHQQLLCSSAEENFSVFDPSRALRDLKHAVQQEHVWEVCCSPESSLTKEARRQGFCATRWSWESGFDLGSAAKVDQMISQIPRMKPTRVWASPKCTSSIQNLTHQTDQQRFELQKKRMRTRREIRHLIRMFKAAYSRKPGHVELYMECPKSATYCWRMKEWEDFRSWMMINHGQPL